MDITLSDAKFNKEKVDEVVLVGGSTRIPKLRKMIQEYFNGKELYKTINPDEAVAHGAAALAVDLSTGASSKIKEFTLYDIVPLPLGINVVGDIMSVVVNKNSKIPSKHYKTVTTVADNQTFIKFSVYQGERTSTMHNKHLGSFSLSGISPAPRRIPRIDVCFDIDSSGILTVTAKDKITGNKNNLQLEAAKLKLTLEEIELMVQEAEKYKLDDIELRNLADMRIKLETLVFNAKESTMSLDSQEKLNKGDKYILLNKCESVFHWLNKNKNASKETLFQQQIEFQNCCHPIFIRICRDKKNESDNEQKRNDMDTTCFPLIKKKQEEQAKMLKQQKKEEEEYKQLQKAKNDVKGFIKTAESKVKWQCFEKFVNEKSAILQNCQTFRNWIEENKNATPNDIYDNLKKFRECSENIFEKMEAAIEMEQHAEFQTDDDMIAQASDERNALEKCAYTIKQSITGSEYKDKLENNVKEEITSGCDRILEWLDENQNASVDECTIKRTELDRICLPLDKIKQEEQKKKEEERNLRQEAQDDLIRFINNAENKAKLKCFEITNAKSAIFQNCQKLRNWVEENQSTKRNDICDKMQEFQKWSEKVFKNMEEAVKAENQKELQLISESKRKLKECADKISEAVSDSKYVEYLSDAELEKINCYCTNTSTLLEKSSNPSRQELDKRRKSIEKNCYSILVQINNQVQTEMKRKEVELQQELVSLEHFSKKVFDVTSRLAQTNKIPSEQANSNFAICNKISELIRNGEIKTRKDCETYYGDILEIYQPIKSLEEEQNMEANKNDYDSRKEALSNGAQPMFDLLDQEKKEAEKDLTSFVEYIKSSASRIQGNDDYKDSIFNKCDEITKWISNNKETNKKDYDSKKRELRHFSQSLLNMLDREKKEGEKDLIGFVEYIKSSASRIQGIDDYKDSIFNKCDEITKWISNNKETNKNDYDSKKRELRHFSQSLLNMLDREKKEGEKDLIGFVEYVKSLTTRIQCNDDYKISVRNKCEEITKWISSNKEPDKNEYDTKKRELQKFSQSLLDQVDEQKKIAEAKANLSVYVKEIINDLDNDASRGFFLSSNHRNQFYGSCAEVRNWLKETKNPSLEEIERKTQQLKTKYQASGLRSNRLVQSDWL
uniref:chromosome partition protein Smc-like n=1 Tax=Styela clava TaxID=7725 RepID=UPI001939700C|nr:chromosome partition protein Smc-like [Styela clava]